MKKQTKTQQLVHLMSTTVFLTEPLIPLSPVQQFNEDMKDIAKWLIRHKKEVTAILTEK